MTVGICCILGVVSPRTSELYGQRFGMGSRLEGARMHPIVGAKKHPVEGAERHHRYEGSVDKVSVEVGNW